MPLQNITRTPQDLLTELVELGFVRRAASQVFTGRKVIAVAGTPERLAATTTPCLWVDVCADPNNNNPSAVGDASVSAQSGAYRGAVLTPLENPLRIFVDDVSTLFGDVGTSGEAVCFAYYTP